MSVVADHDLVRRLRGEVAERLNAQRRRDEAADRAAMSSEDERQYARSLIVQVLEDHARREISEGRIPQTPEEEESTAAAVHAALFGVGRLQPLLEHPEVENIDINGFDQVYVGYSDGREVLHEPVAESDEDLIQLVQVLAANVGLSSRPFDSANPQLDLRLPDGSRMSAVMGVCSRPSISIRRSRLGKVFLDDLVGSGTMNAEIAGFLKAAVKARKNIMLAGATNAGKTTLLRALANEIPPHERIITVERALELGLDQFPELHPNVVCFEERLPNSEGLGAVGMADLVRRSLRHEPEPGDRRRGARRRDRHHAQRDESGQRRLAVHDPREQLDGGVQPHLHLRPAVGRAACRSRPPRCSSPVRSTSWCSCASATPTPRAAA